MKNVKKGSRKLKGKERFELRDAMMIVIFIRRDVIHVRGRERENFLVSRVRKLRCGGLEKYPVFHSPHSIAGKREHYGENEENIPS